MSGAPGSTGGATAAGPAATPMKVLTFEAGSYLFAVPAEMVARIDPSGAVPAGGVSVVDAVGLLRPGEEPPERRCTVVLAAPARGLSQVAVTATRAGEVRMIDAGRLLPLPSYLFAGENPFQGLAPAPEKGGRALFLLASPQRLRAAAEKV